MANNQGWQPLTATCPDDSEREARLSEFTVLDADLRTDDGPMMVVDGVGHDLARLVAFATCDDALGGWLPENSRVPVVAVEPGFWTWSRRIKHCDGVGGGSSCDDEGEWHRHFIQKPSGDPMTLIRLALYTDTFDHPVDMDEYAKSQGWGRN